MLLLLLLLLLLLFEVYGVFNDEDTVFHMTDPFNEFPLRLVFKEKIRPTSLLSLISMEV